MEETAKTAVSGTKERMPSEAEKTADASKSSRLPLIITVIVLVLAGLVYLFISLGPETTGSIRDIMLIIFAVGSVVTVAAAATLCVNLAKLAGFLKYEIKPILATTNKTMKRVSGTVSFLCESAVEPAVDTVSTVSGIKNAANSVLHIFKK